MFNKGTRIKIRTGEHHGKRGTIADLIMRDTRAYAVVTLDTGDTVELTELATSAEQVLS